MRGWHEVFKVNLEAISQHLCCDSVETIRVLLGHQISGLLLEVLHVLLLDDLDQLFEQILLEYIIVLLVRVGEGLAWLREAANIADFDFLTALFEPLLDVAFHIEDLLLHGRVPVIFDRVISATFKVGCDDGPFVIQLAV